MGASVAVGTRSQWASATDATALRVRRWLWCAGLLLGAFQAWVSRFTLSTHDGVSYLDIADAYLRADWQAAINAYWSPLYSWLLAVMLGLLQPSSYWELPAVKLVDFLIFVGALFAFDFFLRALIEQNERQLESSGAPYLRFPKWVWVVAGYSLFFWAALHWTTLYSDTPDLLSSIFVYLAAGILLRARSGADRWIAFLLLGAVLGLGYLAKTAMLPIGLMFLAVGLFSGAGWRRTLPRIVAAGAAFALVSGPFIAALSAKAGHFTFGDSGKHAYALYVYPGVEAVHQLHWQGERPEFGTPEHTTRKIHESPDVFEFATPISGSFPPWYDTAYWHAGMKLSFNFVQQFKVFVKNIAFAWNSFLGALLFGYLAFVLGADRFRPSLMALRSGAVLIVPAVAGLVAYCLATDLLLSEIPTQPVMRYLTAFAVLLFAGAFCSVRMPDTKESRRWSTAIVVAAATAVAGGLLANPVLERFDGRLMREHINWRVASDLRSLGIEPGDGVANIGLFDSLYWARLAGVRIVAQVDKQAGFWTERPETRADVLRAIQRTGARAVVADMNHLRPATASDEGWQAIADGDTYVYVFDREITRLE